MDLNSFLAMGGYAEYVWGSFGVTALVIIGNIVAAKRLRRRVIAEIIELRAEEPGDNS